MTATKRPAALGRGLSALLGDRPAAAEAIRAVPIDALEPGPFQPRSNMAAEPLAELAASIRAHGLLQPILVRPTPGFSDRYQIIGGERRWRAAQMVPLHDVPVVVRNFSDRDAMAAALVENLQRQDLDALEEAEGFRRLIEEFGLTQEALGEAIGKSRSHVANTLRLLGLPPTIRKFVQEGVLTAGHARALLTADDPEALAEQVVAKGLNVRQTEALTAREPNRKPAERIDDPETVALSRELSLRLGLRVSVRTDGAGGQVVLRFRDLDQLDGLVRLLNGG